MTSFGRWKDGVPIWDIHNTTTNHSLARGQALFFQIPPVYIRQIAESWGSLLIDLRRGGCVIAHRILSPNGARFETLWLEVAHLSQTSRM